MKTNYFFVSYGDELYSEQRERIAKEARTTGVFDDVKVFAPEDLPEGLKKKPIFQGRKDVYKRGGGYWCWKPFVILEVLKVASDGDVVVYADSGSIVRKTFAWHIFFFLMKFCDAIFVEIGGKIKNWTRSSIKNYLARRLLLSWWNVYQFMATPTFWKKTPATIAFLEEWCRLVCDPNLVGDVAEKDLPFEDKEFIENRHDQAIMSALVYAKPHLEQFKSWVIPNMFEQKMYFGQIVFCARKSNDSQRSKNDFENPIMTCLRLLNRTIRWVCNRMICIWGRKREKF